MIAEPNAILPLRITLLRPPLGVAFALQLGRAELVPPSRATPEALTFDFEVRLSAGPQDEPPRFLGKATQGPPQGRFVYVNSGIGAGQKGTPWSRRAKVPLGGISWDLLAALRATPGSRLEARIEGTGRDGGPACATVPILGGGWAVVVEMSSSP